jgi:Immunity protein Imm1
LKPRVRSYTVVAGDSTGTVVLYYPPGYEGVGSLHSVGDAEAAAKNRWEPPLTAFYFGHHTEFPRWSVVTHDLGARAAREFCERPGEPPTAVMWEAD